MKLKELAAHLNGVLQGDPNIEITSVAGIDDTVQGSVTMLKDSKRLKALNNLQASAVIVNALDKDVDIAQIVVSNPALAFIEVLHLFYSKQPASPGVSESASIAADVTLGLDVSILSGVHISSGVSIGESTVLYPGVFIGENSSVGSNCIIYPNVSIMDKVSIGNGVIIHAGSVIGSDGFGYVPHKGRHVKIPQVGGVIIGDDVEIGANVTIDRSTTGSTVIGEGTRIDNLVQIAHNVKIGKHCIIVAQTGIAGSCAIGDYVVLGGQVGVADHTQIESGTQVGAQSGVMGFVNKDIYLGSPAVNHRQYKKSYILFKKLPELKDTLSVLEKKVSEMYEHYESIVKKQNEDNG